MTTAHSPLRALKAQSDKIAQVLKAAERGEKIGVQFAEKITTARGKESVTFAVFMDDKIIKIEMPWATIRATSEGGISEYILAQMREAREAAQTARRGLGFQ